MAMLRTDNFDAMTFTDEDLENDLFSERIWATHEIERLEWPTAFVEMYYKAIGQYRKGKREPENLFSSEEMEFLSSIGCASQELYDFVEDWCELGEPSLDIVGRITAVRRQYFLFEQNSQQSLRLVSLSSLPSKESKLGGFVWLPRIIAKARAKLRGEIHPEVMYGCGADRSFLRRVGIDPAEFLGVVWSAGNDDHKILDFILHKNI